VRLHLHTASHLATVRSYGHDPMLTAHLSMLVARSSAVVHGTRPRSLRTMWHTLTVGFPAAVWHSRRAILVATVAFMIGAVAVGAWVAMSDHALQAVGPEHMRNAYTEHQFADYYSSEPAPTFAARIFTNNASVGALAWISGIVFGVPTLWILLFNGVNVGVAGGLFYAVGDPGTFWGLILPHGLLELTAVFVAGGAGLQLGWAAIAPGDRSRRGALAQEGRRSVVIVVGLVLVFLVAGLIEAFVTPAPWPTWARVGTGAAVWAAFLLWIWAAGRRAAAQGLTGALGETPNSGATAHHPPPALVSR
jgi:uncharacterized membrane protein SpoIIM required for sporulation